ncbi:MAG TPA: SpoIIE family protein phosphatase [Thermoleophilaceae bacterium]
MAWPVAAKRPEDKGPPPGQAKKAAAPGQAKKAAPGQAKKSAPPGQANRAAPPGQAKKAVAPGQAKKAAPPGQAKKAAPPAASGPAPGARRVRARAAARRRAAAAWRRAVATRRARRVRADRRAAAAALLANPTVRAAFSGDTPAASSPARPTEERSQPRKERSQAPFVPVTPQDDLPRPLRVVRDIVEVVPTPLRLLLAGLVALSILLAAVSGLTLLRNRRLAAQRRELLGEVGLLQAALLPELPEKLASGRASVAYRPADGPGAGGDFYDVLPLAGGQTAILIGDVSGHGRAALGRTTLARYTLRAYLEAGLEPREALQIAGAVLAGKLQGDFVTALLAIHDPAAGTLTYAAAGHPPPIVVSGAAFTPVLVGTAPPLGVGASTGQRQTTLPFPRGAVACFYTDGLSEARTADGRLGSAQLEGLVRELGPDVTAQQVIDGVTSAARTITDDAAVCVIAATEGAGILRSRVERLEISRAELRGSMLSEFLEACDVSVHGVRAAERDAREIAGRAGGALVEVRMGDRPQVDVLAPDLPVRDDVTSSLRQP